MLFLTLQGKCITGKFGIFIIQSNPYGHLDHYYGQFALSLRKESLNGNVEKTGTSQRRKTNRFNNNKSLAVQDESDMNTPEEENTHAQYTTVTATGTAC